MMKDISKTLGTLYHPISALVIYQTKGSDQNTYVEHFDMDHYGNPINAHPLTDNEAKYLSKALLTETDKTKSFLRSEGILSQNVLYINSAEKGSVIWYTKAKKAKLFFSKGLEIPNGTAEIPALLWSANKQYLRIFALSSDKRPTEMTSLFFAPFFNVYKNGNVCMGTVDVNVRDSASVEEFTEAWETYFFNSYFSHLMNNHNPVNGNCVGLWKGLVNTNHRFPKAMLRKTGQILKNILP